MEQNLISIYGSIQKKEVFDNRTVVTIETKTSVFHVVAWNNEVIESLEKFQVGQFVGCKTKIKNSNYEKEGKTIYGFSFELLKMGYTISRPKSSFRFQGRLTKELSIRNLVKQEDDYIVGSIAINGSKTSTFINFLCEYFNENLGLFEKGDEVEINGNIQQVNGSYTFYALDITKK